jgi:hypothetical protein
MITLKESIDRVQRKLDDLDGDVWTRAQVEEFILDGYDGICREAECIFDVTMFSNAPNAANHTRVFEEQFMTDMPILGRFTFTKESDREYAGPDAVGPSNHTKTSDAAYMTTAGETPSGRVVGTLPDTYVSVDRVTHDWLRLEPEPARYLRQTRNIYQTETGGVFSYSMDQDGLFSIRTVGAVAPVAPAIEISGTYGAVRALDTLHGFDAEPISGTYGVIRSMPRHFASGSQYGIIKRIVPDDLATRVELFRLGNPMTEQDAFEIPDRAVRYVEWWAMYRAYSTPGEGEDGKLAELFKGRYAEGVKRLKNRVDTAMNERTIQMGSGRSSRRDDYLTHMPSTYGYSTGRRH